jgi:hypothetical protein
MFGDFYNAVSKLFSWRWPIADGEITAVRYLSPDEGLVVEYKFSLGDDGPYTGESRWSPWFAHTDVMDIHKTLPIGSPITVRYRPGDPSVNTLDREAWDGL